MIWRGKKYSGSEFSFFLAVKCFSLVFCIVCNLLRMPHSCCVPHCGRTADRFPELAWHGFPKDHLEKKTWLGKIRRDERTDVPRDHPDFFKVTDSTKVCSDYFKAEDYLPGDRKRKDKKSDISRKNLNRRAKVYPSMFSWTDDSKSARKKPTPRSEPPAKRKKTTAVSEGEDAGATMISTGDTAQPAEADMAVASANASTCAAGRCAADHGCPRNCFKEMEADLELTKAKLDEVQSRCDMLE